jgi:predicted PP-loop superfamily ATPase
MEKQIKLLIAEEMQRAIKKFKPFNSAHEGHGVIREEVEELDEVNEKVNEYLDKLWKQIKTNGKNFDSPSIGYCVEMINKYAIECIKEAIQVAAMAQRYEQDIINK